MQLVPTGNYVNFYLTSTVVKLIMGQLFLLFLCNFCSFFSFTGQPKVS